MSPPSPAPLRSRLPSLPASPFAPGLFALAGPCPAIGRGRVVSINEKETAAGKPPFFRSCVSDPRSGDGLAPLAPAKEAKNRQACAVKRQSGRKRYGGNRHVGIFKRVGSGGKADFIEKTRGHDRGDDEADPLADAVELRIVPVKGIYPVALIIELKAVIFINGPPDEINRGVGLIENIRGVAVFLNG